MNNLHPSEMELQQFAMGKTDGPARLMGHVQSCEACQSTVAIYQLLMNEIRQMPKPAFDFDISSLVLAQLPQRQPRPFLSLGFFIRALLIGAIGTPLYLFRKNILQVFAEISTVFMYAILGAALTFLIVQIINMYKNYQQQMEILN
jgi:hypothetical protein